MSRTGTPNLSRRGSYVNYEEKERLRTKTPTLRGADFGVSPLLQNMSRRGSTIIGGDVLWDKECTKEEPSLKVSFSCHVTPCAKLRPE